MKLIEFKVEDGVLFSRQRKITSFSPHLGCDSDGEDIEGAEQFKVGGFGDWEPILDGVEVFKSSSRDSLGNNRGR